MHACLRIVEVVREICSYLSRRDIIRLCQVSQLLKRTGEELLWVDVDLRFFSVLTGRSPLAPVSMFFLFVVAKFVH